MASTSSPPPSIEALYLAAKRSFVGLANDMTSDDWATDVPCCPGWTARDVLSHVSGIPDDAMAGRLDGVATEPWTASQVERNREFTVEELLERWEQQAPLFASVIDRGGQGRPPIDCHSHEHDIRHALGWPGNRSDAIVQHTACVLVESLVGPFHLVVELSDATQLVGGGADRAASAVITLRDVTPFEIFRSRLGRRTSAQVECYDWSGPRAGIDAVIADWFAFGPSEIEIVEP